MNILFNISLLINYIILLNILNKKKLPRILDILDNFLREKKKLK